MMTQLDSSRGQTFTSRIFKEYLVPGSEATPRHFSWTAWKPKNHAGLCTIRSATFSDRYRNKNDRFEMILIAHDIWFYDILCFAWIEAASNFFLEVFWFSTTTPIFGFSFLVLKSLQSTPASIETEPLYIIESGHDDPFHPSFSTFLALQTWIFCSHDCGFWLFLQHLMPGWWCPDWANEWPVPCRAH